MKEIVVRHFEPVVEETRQHANFKSMLRIGNGFNFDILNEWANGFIDRDGKFVEEFQTTFNSSFWMLCFDSNATLQASLSNPTSR